MFKGNKSRRKLTLDVMINYLRNEIIENLVLRKRTLLNKSKGKKAQSIRF